MSGVLYFGAGMYLVADHPAARAAGANGASISPDAAIRSRAPVGARTRARRQSVRGLHAGAAQSLPARHRAVHRRHFGDQHLPLLRAARDGGEEVRRSWPSARRCSPASMSSCRCSSSSRSCTLTGLIATRLGVIALLVTIPIVMVFGLTVYAAFGTFSVLAAAMVLRRWGEYAFIRPGREMLFSKVDTESKYKAKNVCDVAVYRIADAVVRADQEAARCGRHGRRGAGADRRAAVAALWAVNGWWLGRRFEKEKQLTSRKMPAVGVRLHGATVRCRAQLARLFPLGNGGCLGDGGVRVLLDVRQRRRGNACIHPAWSRCRRGRRPCSRGRAPRPCRCRARRLRPRW